MRRPAPFLAPAFVGLVVLAAAFGAYAPGGAPPAYAAPGASAAPAVPGVPAGPGAPAGPGSAGPRPAPAPVAPAPTPPDLAAPPPNAQRTYSGLTSVVLQPGTGVVHPAPEDTLAFHFVAWDKRGNTVGNSYATDQPVALRGDQIIEGLTEGARLMVAGEKRRFWVPAKLAYSERPFRKAPAGDLVVDFELLAVKAAPKPPAVPADVSGVPKAAKRTASGLAFRTLRAGDGKQSPKVSDGVEVHYTGWTIDGRMFDSSVVRGKPAKFRANAVIKGWTEGLQQMKVGDKTRFWIPADLAYGETPAKPGVPSGMLVFDIELLNVFDPSTVTNPHEMQ